MSPSDNHLRTAAFEWISRQVQIRGEDVLPAVMLKSGFKFQDHKIFFISQLGILRPRGFDVPLTIRTGLNSPYDDQMSDDGFLIYDYEGTNPNLQSNRGLRQAMQDQIPLIYLKVVPDSKPVKYMVLFPVFIVHDDSMGKSFLVDLQPALSPSATTSLTETASHYPEELLQGIPHVGEDSAPERRYALRTYHQRLHQARFRENVLNAYSESCTMCHLRHRELLDAAHIIEDRKQDGEAIVPNGLALCKIHHAAFDHHVIGISPDYRIEVREDILDEIDGPMLRHGIQELHGQTIQIPRRTIYRPDRDRLAIRYDRFRRAV